MLGEVDPEGLAAAAGNPVAMLASRGPGAALAAGRRPGFRARLERAESRLGEHLSGPSWYETLPGAPAAIAYFSPEFGLSEALPQYSGGLGILAGDHLKAASDLGVPIVGIGLFYRNGYFRQVLTAAGAQQRGVQRARPGSAAPDRGARRRRRAHADRRAAAGRDAARRTVAGRGRSRAAAAARRRRPGQRPGGARRHRPPLRRRQRAPPAAGDPARHRRRQGARGVRHRARGVPHERGPRRLPRARARARARGGRQRSRACAAARARAHGVHDAHARAGRHRPLLARAHDALLRAGRRADRPAAGAPARAREPSPAAMPASSTWRRSASAWPRA